MDENTRRAVIALRNGIGRALKHLATNNPTLAIATLNRGVKTAESWLDGTHPKASPVQ